MLSREININNIKKMYTKEPIFSFTIDIDWASEEAIEYCIDIFKKYDIPLTIFLTHPSSYLSNKYNDPKIEWGIHPNFIKDSSHGNNIEEVMDYCLKLLPSVRCFRSHRYYDVNDITDRFYKMGFKYDSNLCTLMQDVDPFIHRSGLLRFPVFLEDGAYLLHNNDLNFNNVRQSLFDTPGLKVINIHPMHMVVNSPNFMYGRNIKDSLSREEWNSLTKEEFRKISYNNMGIRDFIVNLLEHIKNKNFKSYTLDDLYNISIQNSIIK